MKTKKSSFKIECVEGWLRSSLGLATLVFLVTPLLVGCGHKPIAEFCDGESVNTVDDSRLDVLVQGDSISMGYTPYLSLPGYDFLHNLCNGMHSSHAVQRMNVWHAQRPNWYAIVFNHGIWDAALSINTPHAKYRANLHYIAQAIKLKTQRPLFVLTTEILPGTANMDDSRVQALNLIALEVMAEEGVPVLDLHSVSQTIRSEHVDPINCHYTEAGSATLGAAIMAELDRLYGIN